MTSKGCGRRLQPNLALWWNLVAIVTLEAFLNCRHNLHWCAFGRKIGLCGMKLCKVLAICAQGQYKEAAERAVHAAELDPGFVRAHARAGKACLCMGRWEQVRI